MSRFPAEVEIFRLEAPRSFSDRNYPSLRHLDGTPIVDERGHPYKAFHFLPQVIPARPPAHLFELWLGRSDGKVQTRDMFIRINSTSDERLMTSNAINMQRVRFRNQFNLPCWTKRPAVPTLPECLVFEQITGNQVHYNTTLPVLDNVGLLMPALPESQTVTQPLTLPLDTYTGGLGPHVASQRLKEVFKLIAMLQDTATKRGYAHWIFLENKYKPKAWSLKAESQGHPYSDPDDIALSTFNDIPEAAAAWIEECVREAARNRAFLPPLSKFPPLSRKRVHSMIAQVAVEIGQPIEDLLPVETPQSAANTEPLRSTKSAKKMKPVHSRRPAQISQRVQNTLRTQNNQSAQDGQPMQENQPAQVDTEDEWTDTSISDTEIEVAAPKDDHNIFSARDIQHADMEGEWTDTSGSDTEIEETNAKNNDGAHGISDVEQGQITEIPGFVAINNQTKQYAQNHGEPGLQQGRTDVVPKPVLQPESKAVDEGNHEGVQKVGTSFGQTSVMTNPVTVNTNGVQQAMHTTANGHTAMGTYTNPYVPNHANGGAYNGVSGSRLAQFNSANAHRTGCPPPSTAQYGQPLQAVSNPTGFIRRRRAPVVGTQNAQANQGNGQNQQPAFVVRRRPAPSAAAQNAHALQRNAESFDPAAFLRRRVATDTANQSQLPIQGNPGEFHISMLRPYLEQFAAANAHLVRRRSESPTRAGQPSKGNVRSLHKRVRTHSFPIGNKRRKL